MHHIVTDTAELKTNLEPHEAAQRLVDSWQPLLQNCTTQESLNELLVFCIASILRDRKEVSEPCPAGDAWFQAHKTGKGVVVKMNGLPEDLAFIFSQALGNSDFRRIFTLSLVKSGLAHVI